MFDAEQFERGADLRGEYPRELNEELAWFAGRYFVRYLESTGAPQPRIIVGRDGRRSSPGLYAALVQGIATAGGTPIPAGLCTTDMVVWGTGAGLHGAVAGAMVTASHNPAKDNGIKMTRRAQHAVQTVIIKDHIKPHFERDRHEGDVHAAPATCAPFPVSPAFSLLPDFAAWTCRWAPDAAQFTGRVVLDTGNGVGGLFLKPLLQHVPAAKIDAIFTEIDGSFPNRPSNPSLPGALDTLKAEVRRAPTLFGAAFDGDADRLFLVDEQGTFVTGDQLLAAIASSILDDPARSFAPGKPVVFAATCSWLLVETIRRFGGTPYICRVGQETVKAAMQAVQADFGGESSAHFNFPESYFQDSGLIALMAFWQYLHARAKKPVSQVIAALRPWPHSGEINMELKSEKFRAISLEAVKRLTERYQAKANNRECYVFGIDGVSVYFPFRNDVPNVDALFPILPANEKGDRFRGVHASYRPDWWFNIRRSNNEPLIRVNVECQAGADVVMPTTALLRELIAICQHELGCPVAVKDWGAIGKQEL